MPDQVGTAAEVERNLRQTAVHRQEGEATAADTGKVSQGPPHGAAEDDANILDEMMRIDLNITFRLHFQTEPAMTGESVEHVPEEGEWSDQFCRFRGIAIDADGNPRFAGDAFVNAGSRVHV
jgi:hypothetical protein